MINKNVRVKLDLDFVKSTILMELVSKALNDLENELSLDSMIKYVLLQEIGKEMVDQVIPENEQEEMLDKKGKQNDMLAHLLRKEREGKQ